MKDQFSRLVMVVVLAVLAMSLSACGPNAGQISNPTPTSPPIQPTPTEIPLPSPTADPGTPTPEGGAVNEEVQVDSVEILMLESFPVQVRALVKGSFPDACTNIGEITQKRDGNNIEVTLLMVRPKDVLCAQIITPFEETIPIDAVGLKAGTYTVTVNGVSAPFTLDTDNVSP